MNGGRLRARLREAELPAEATGIPLCEAWLRDDEPLIRLHVLPPRRPQWRRRPAQGRGVERANRSARTEFRNLYDGPPAVADVAPRLARHEFFHNYRRPHWALDCRTPNECLVGIEDAA